MAQVDIQHIAYRGITSAVSDLITGRVSMAFAASTMALPQVQEGKLRALAVTSRQRSPAAPNIPTMSEAGFAGFDASAWFGLMAPSGTPAPIIDRLYHETARILHASRVAQKTGAPRYGSRWWFASRICSHHSVGASALGAGNPRLACDSNRVAWDCYRTPRFLMASHSAHGDRRLRQAARCTALRPHHRREGRAREPERAAADLDALDLPLIVRCSCARGRALPRSRRQQFGLPASSAQAKLVAFTARSW